MLADIGPVEYMIVAFPGNEFRGEILPELAQLADSRTIRIIDFAFVGKDEEGNTLAFEMTELDPEVQRSLESMGATVEGLFNDDDLRQVADSLEPGNSAALLIWEDVWATRLVKALENANAQVLEIQRVPREIVKAAREYAVAAAQDQEGA